MLKVAVMLIDPAALYVPSPVVDEKLETVGAAVSMTIADDPAMLLAPLGTVVEVITFPAASVGALVSK